MPNFVNTLIDRGKKNLKKKSYSDSLRIHAVSEQVKTASEVRI